MKLELRDSNLLNEDKHLKRLFFTCGSDSKESACNIGTWVQSLDKEDPLVEEMTPHSSILAGKIPWTKELGGLQSMGLQRVGHD